MPNVSRNSINLSVKNASAYVNSIKAGERTLAFYLGSVDTLDVSKMSDDDFAKLSQKDLNYLLNRE